MQRRYATDWVILLWRVWLLRRGVLAIPRFANREKRNRVRAKMANRARKNAIMTAKVGGRVSVRAGVREACAIAGMACAGLVNPAARVRRIAGLAVAVMACVGPVKTVIRVQSIVGLAFAAMVIARTVKRATRVRSIAGLAILAESAAPIISLQIAAAVGFARPILPACLTMRADATAGSPLKNVMVRLAMGPIVSPRIGGVIQTPRDPSVATASATPARIAAKIAKAFRTQRFSACQPFRSSRRCGAGRRRARWF
jgi:hypothetical protein